MAATTTLLGLVTPTQGTLTGTWGDTVNYGISDYLDIAIAGTLSFAGDGAITLANTTGSSSGNSIGATTAQYAIIRVTGTLTTAKIITGPSYSKTYLVVNAATGSTVTFKASGQTGVSIAVGETALVYYNGTDYVKVVGTATAGAAGGSTTQVQYNNAGVLAGITGATSNGTALTLVAPNLGSPASVGTMPAFTLGGTVSGGGNQINNVVIGASSPLAGTFTTLGAATSATFGTTRQWYITDGPSAVSWMVTDAAQAGSGILANTSTVYLRANSTTVFESSSSLVTANVPLQVTGTLSATGTLSGGTSGTAYSFSGSAPATSLTLDSSGNLGVGVAPSAWASANPIKAIQVGRSGSISYDNGSASTNIVAGAYLSATGQWTKIGTTGAAKLALSDYDGSFFWSRAASGSGNFTYTDVMVLDASGNLGIGTSSPAQKLQLSSADTTGTAINITNTSTGGYNWNIFSVGSSSVIGNVGSLAFRDSTNGVTRMTLDSSGNLKVGTTSSANAHILETTTSGVYSTQFISSTASSPYGSNIYFSGAAPNGTSNQFLYCNDSSALRVEVRSNGGIANYSANDVNLSDRREKTNFAPATSYLDKICAIPVQTFNYIDQNLEQDGGLTLGVVAQDVQAIAPELVMESNWAKQGDEPKMRLSIYQTDLQYALMKCIQEQQALITQLTARITALETA